MGPEIMHLDLARQDQVARFVDLPGRLHGASPGWSAPWRPSMVASLDPARHPFYAHSEAAFFLAVDRGRDVGRIAVLENRNFNRHRGTRLGHFCYFEAEDDARVVTALVAAGADWLRRRGLEAMAGPRALLEVDGGGIMVEGFDEPPSQGLAYAPPYYGARLAAAGLQKETDFLSGRLLRGHRLDPRFERIVRRLETRGQMRLVTPDSRRQLRRLAQDVMPVYEAAFSVHPAYYPRTPAEKAWMLEEWLAVADPGLTRLVQAGGRPAGFLLAWPDLAPGLRRAWGRSPLLGAWQLWRARSQARTALIGRVGVLPEYQGGGANVLLYQSIQDALVAADYDRAEIQLVEESNRRSLTDMEAIGVTWHKRHRQYRLEL